MNVLPERCAAGVGSCDLAHRSLRLARSQLLSAAHPRIIQRRGFSLVELVVVILVIGIIAAVAAPKYGSSFARYRVEAAAKRVVADLELARRNAKFSSASRTVIFFVGLESYSLSGIKNPDHPGNTFFGVPYYWVDLEETGYAAQLVSANFGGNGIVVFDRYGRPNDGGTVVVQSGSLQKTVTVDATTGKAKVQ